MEAYAGSFGDRIISAEGGSLYSQRGGGPKAKLLPVRKHLFLMEPDPATRLEFAVSEGSAASVSVIRADGRRMDQARAN